MELVPVSLGKHYSVKTAIKKPVNHKKFSKFPYKRRKTIKNVPNLFRIISIILLLKNKRVGIQIEAIL